MALWATKHSQGRPSSVRLARAVLVRWSVAAVLLIPAALVLAPVQASAMPVPVPVPMIRDTSAPPISTEATGGDPAAATSVGARGTVPSQPGDVLRQGNVVALFNDPTDPLIVLAVENGYLTVRLRCGSLCPSIHIGDFVVAEGQRRSEAVLDARDVWVVVP
jgi:hypothetical protein